MAQRETVSPSMTVAATAPRRPCSADSSRPWWGRDAEGKPTGRTELRYGKDGEAGYLRWLAANHPGYFAALYGKLLALEVNQKVEEKTVVHYETLEERRAAMIAKGWAPSAVAALGGGDGAEVFAGHAGGGRESQSHRGGRRGSRR